MCFRVFIKRDPTCFPVIINLMKGSLRYQNNKSSPWQHLIQQEYRFYMGTGLVQENSLLPFAGIILNWLPNNFSLLYRSTRFVPFF